MRSSRLRAGLLAGLLSGCATNQNRWPDGALCNDVQNTAAPVTQTEMPGDPPASLGGSIVDGTYLLTATTRYLGSRGAPSLARNTYQTTLRIEGGRSAAISLFNGAETRTSAMFHTGGATLTFEQQCPTVSVGDFGYTADARTLTLIGLADSAGGVLVSVYTRQ